MKLFAAPRPDTSYAIGSDGLVYWFFGPGNGKGHRGDSLDGTEWDVFTQLYPDGLALQAAVRKEFEAANPNNAIVFSEDEDDGNTISADSTHFEGFEFGDVQIEYLVRPDLVLVSSHDYRQMYLSCPPAGGRDFKYNLWPIPEESSDSDSDSDTYGDGRLYADDGDSDSSTSSSFVSNPEDEDAEPALTLTRLEYTNWAFHSWIDQTGHMYLVHEGATDTLRNSRANSCNWARFPARKMVKQGTGPELRLTTPEGEDFWLDDLTYYVGASSCADMDSDEDE